MRSPKRTKNYRPLETYKTDLFSTPFYTMRFVSDYEEIVRDVRKAISVIEQKYGDDNVRNYTTYFDMDIQATRFNWYRDSSDWKPYHHDAAAMKAHMATKQNSFHDLSLSRY